MGPERRGGRSSVDPDFPQIHFTCAGSSMSSRKTTGGGGRSSSSSSFPRAKSSPMCCLAPNTNSDDDDDDDDGDQEEEDNNNTDDHVGGIEHNASGKYERKHKDPKWRVWRLLSSGTSNEGPRPPAAKPQEKEHAFKFTPSWPHVKNADLAATRTHAAAHTPPPSLQPKQANNNKNESSPPNNKI